MTILTKDKDFKSLSSYSDCPPKVIKLNCGNKSSNAISEILTSKIEEISHFLKQDPACY